MSDRRSFRRLEHVPQGFQDLAPLRKCWYWSPLIQTLRVPRPPKWNSRGRKGRNLASFVYLATLFPLRSPFPSLFLSLFGAWVDDTNSKSLCLFTAHFSSRRKSQWKTSNVLSPQDFPSMLLSYTSVIQRPSCNRESWRRPLLEDLRRLEKVIKVPRIFFNLLLAKED